MRFSKMDMLLTNYTRRINRNATGWSGPQFSLEQGVRLRHWLEAIDAADWTILSAKASK